MVHSLLKVHHFLQDTTNETKLDTIESNEDVTDTGNVHPIIDVRV